MNFTSENWLQMGEFGILDAWMLYFGWSILVFRKVYLVFGMVCLLFRSGIFYIWYLVFGIDLQSIKFDFTSYYSPVYK